MSPINNETLIDRNRRFTLTSWTAQSQWDPIPITRGEGVHFWDAEGKRYLDWSSQLFNLNLGHGHPAVRQAIHEQVDRLQYAMPALASEPRAALGQQLAEITHANLTKAFFTTGGSDAVENAIKAARLATGKQKILSRSRAYHGATFGAMSAGGDPRRLPNEPGVPWIVRLPDPYTYRSPHYRGRTREEGDRAVIEAYEEIIQLEGPDRIAAILLEGYSGTSGIIQGGEEYWKGIQELKERYNLLLIIDEVLSGFGRTGRWFGIDHYPWVEPDLMVMAKGLTGGYIPLGAVMLSEKLANHFDEYVFYGGLTHSSHPVACAAGVAAVNAYRDENLIDHAFELGKKLRAGLMDLAEKYHQIGDVRGVGCHFVLELVEDRESKTPLSPYNAPLSSKMTAIKKGLLKRGLSTFVKWNWIFSAPPLISTEDDIREGLANLDETLEDCGIE